jgi:hypothetical protein
MTRATRAVLYDFASWPQARLGFAPGSRRTTSTLTGYRLVIGPRPGSLPGDPRRKWCSRAPFHRNHLLCSPPPTTGPPAAHHPYKAEVGGSKPTSQGDRLTRDRSAPRMADSARIASLMSGPIHHDGAAIVATGSGVDTDRGDVIVSIQ